MKSHQDNRVIESFKRLKDYCEHEGFRGWDPYDGLNSRLFQALPLLKRSAICRLIVIQGFKRTPFNLRRLALIPKDYNPKGIGLLLGGYCNLHEAVKASPELAAQLGSPSLIEQTIVKLGDLLLSLQSQGYNGSCWGYNFDWQARRLFLFPKFTPSVVVTTFCATALLQAYDITGRKEYLEAALSSAKFIVNDLHRTDCPGGYLFSYSPLPGNDTVFNASLMGSRLLAECYARTGDESLVAVGKPSVEACVAAQRADGAWVYGMLPVQSWVDSFHTGYNLTALHVWRRLTGDKLVDDAISRGLDYYMANFFETDGTPKYYDHQTYPIDIHCPGQLLVTLSELGLYGKYGDVAERVVDWTIDHMQDRRGYFYYQLKKGVSSKISYMRWSNAFMLNALSYYLLNLENHK